MDIQSSNSDTELKNLLTDWHLEQHYEHFMQQKITMSILRILQNQHIEKLFKDLPVGDQAMFEHRLAIWKQTLLLGDYTYTNKPEVKVQATQSEEVERPKRKNTPPVVNMAESVIKIDETSEIVDLLVPTDSNETAENDLLEITEQMTPNYSSNLLRPMSSGQTTQPMLSHTSQRSYNPTPPSAARVSHASSIPSSVTMPPQASSQDIRINLPQNSQNPTHVRYSLHKILNETSGGQVILNYYETHKILREEHRTALINVIARYIDANGCSLSLSESNNLENQIVEMFPTEREEFYRTSKRGRLYNKIANMKRIYKKFKRDTMEVNQGVSGQSSPSSSNNLIKEEYVEELDDYMINDMRVNIQTTDDFMEFWKRTQSSRLRDIDSIDSLRDILDKWPEYKQSDALDYITMDFLAKYPKATRFSDVFYQNAHKLEKLLFAKVSNCSVAFKHMQLYHKCSVESQHLLILWVMHQLFPPNHQTKVDEMGVKRKKRYSIQDSQNSCICIRGSRSGLDNMLRSKTTATPPLILVIGELGGETEEVYVYFEGLRYPVSTVVQAAQLCCELFFLFNIDFPEESVLYYNFVQTFFLNIPPEMKNSRIYTTINDINACEA